MIHGEDIWDDNIKVIQRSCDKNYFPNYRVDTPIMKNLVNASPNLRKGMNSLLQKKECNFVHGYFLYWFLRIKILHIEQSGKVRL